MAAANNPERLELGENHRRAVSAVLREVEQMCDAAEHWVDRRGGIFLQPQDDLLPEQVCDLRRLVTELRGELRRLDSEMTIDHSKQSRCRALIALLSTSIANLEDTDSSRLKGYGPLPEAAKTQIDAAMQRLISLMERMVQVTLAR